jgi:hypothetical protein
MRVLKDNKSRLPAAGDQTQKGEVDCTCTKCLSAFAFRATDPEVITTNEMEYLVNCPVCEAPLLVEKHSGIVRQRETEN